MKRRLWEEKKEECIHVYNEFVQNPYENKIWNFDLWNDSWEGTKRNVRVHACFVCVIGSSFVGFSFLKKISRKLGVVRAWNTEGSRLERAGQTIGVHSDAQKGGMRQ